MVNAQTWLDQNYPPKGKCIRKTEKEGGHYYTMSNYDKNRTEITLLSIANKNLEGHLDLRGFSNLEGLICSSNQLTSLDVSDCPRLEKIQGYNNKISSLDLSKNKQLIELNFCDNELSTLDLAENTKLRKLKIGGNKIESDLSIFSHLIDLEELRIGRGYKKNDYTVNKFFGSLKPLVNLKKLVWLNINFQSDLEADLEYLPVWWLSYFYCAGTKAETLIVRNEGSDLSDFDLSFHLKIWQWLNLEKIHSAQPELVNSDRWKKAVEKKAKEFTNRCVSEINWSSFLLKKRDFWKRNLIISILVNIVLILYIVWNKWKVQARKKQPQN